MREKKKKRDPRLEDEHDDKIISNISKKKRKLVHAPIRHNDRNRQIAMMKKRYQSKIIAGHHIDDCVRDAMSLSTRYNGLDEPFVLSSKIIGISLIKYPFLCIKKIVSIKKL